jgi:hypothetical protein
LRAYKNSAESYFEAKLDRIEASSRDPTPWEGDCLLKAVQAMATDSWMLAGQRIEMSEGRPASRFHAPPICVTVVGLRSALAVVRRMREMHRDPLAVDRAESSVGNQMARLGAMGRKRAPAPPRKPRGQGLKLAADMRATALASTILELRAAGFITLAAIAEELNRRQVPTARGGKKWHLTTVSRLLARLSLDTGQFRGGVAAASPQSAVTHQQQQVQQQKATEPVDPEKQTKH